MTATQPKPFHPGIQEKADLGARGRGLIDRIDAFADLGPPPKRAIRLVIDLGADTLDDLEHALDEIMRSVRGRSVSATSGAVGHGYHFEVERHDVTHDEFVEALYAWREARR